MNFWWFGELFWLIYYLLLGIVGSVFTLSDKKTKGSSTIVLLHGICSRGLSLRFLKKRLIRAGYSVFVPNLSWHTGAIEKSADELNRFILKKRLIKPLIVGYSVGGLISYQFAAKYGNLKGLVTVGSPFNGSWLADVFPFLPAAKQIDKKGNFLRQLEKLDVTVPVLNISASSDEIIRPFTKGFSNVTKLRIPEVGHVNLLYSLSAFDYIQASLGELDL